MVKYRTNKVLGNRIDNYSPHLKRISRKLLPYRQRNDILITKKLSGDDYYVKITKGEVWLN